MTQHIGIVACMAEGPSLCYRTICAEGARWLGPRAHPEVSLHAYSLAQYETFLKRGDLAGVAELMLSSAEKLAGAGADFLICPVNTLHQAFGFVEPRSPRPWLHIADSVAAEAARHGYRRLGVAGTRWLVDSEVYPERLAPRGIECLRPGAADRDELNRIILDELVYGQFPGESVAFLQGLVEWMKGEGCDAVILGCTELPLVLDDSNSALPTLDSCRLLARAALERAVGGAVVSP